MKSDQSASFEMERPTNDRSLAKDLYEGLSGVVPEDSLRVILTLGSGDLSETLALSGLYPHSKLFAFECHPLSIKKSREKLAQSEKIELVPLAVHNTNGTVEFFPIDSRRSNNLGASSLFRASEQYDSAERYPQTQIDVQATRLDSWARARGIHQVDLICMDLQGAELLALNGLGQLLRGVSAISTKIAHREIYTGQVLFPALNAYLSECGFALLRNREEVPGWSGEALYVRQGLMGAKNAAPQPQSSRENAAHRGGSIGKKVAIVFENRIRPDTTGMYCLRALSEISEVTHFLPDDVPGIPRSAFDLYLQIDDGTSPGALEGLHPSAFWAIDTHLAYERLLEISRTVDFVFCAQRPAVERMKHDGIEEVTWLPLAADPESHRSIPADEVFDVAFVGNVVTDERRAILEHLRARFPKSFVGRAFGEDWKRISSQSRVLFNQSIRGDLNMRVFESLATGKPLVTDALPKEAGLEELFEVETHLVTFAETHLARQPDGRCIVESSGFTQRIEELLSSPERRARIGAEGRALVLAEHTYRNRMESILETCVGKPRVARAETSQLRLERSIPGEAKLSTQHESRVGSLTSIIIPCKDALSFTKECLASVERYTDQPYELVLVDNASTDGTREFFADLLEAPRSPWCTQIRVIRNEENLGFARAINQGIKVSTGDGLLLLNNDVVVSRDWLSGLLLTARCDPRWALVGPMTNYTAPPQLVERVPYQTVEEFHRFAAWWKNKERAVVEQTGRLTGFCLYLKRIVLDSIGALDEGFEIGFFEDDDLCLRARNAGFLCFVAREVFVHHYGSQTFKLLGIDVEKQLDLNYARFSEKWGDRAKAWKPPSGRKLAQASAKTPEESAPLKSEGGNS